MTELVFLRSKAYAFKINNSKKEIKRLKGISKLTFAKNISFKDYQDAIFKPYLQPRYDEMYVMNSKNHEIFVFKQLKKSVSPFDDKRIVLENAVLTIPYGSDELYFI